jgi:hypothetical protein
VATGGLNGPAIDWQAPWLAPLRDLRPLAEHADWRAALSAEAHRRGVTTDAGLPIRFVAADDAGTVAYETHIAATGRVPTRDNAHDLFNALAWLAFPLAKAALNARQAQELARDGVRGRRGPVRDAATLIDESGLLLAAGEQARAALLRLDWDWLFAAQRPNWGRQWMAFAFGHALVDKLRAPYKRLTAVVVCLPLQAATAAEVDRAAAAWLRQEALAPPLLAHLPVLGIPGWWPANAEPGFYDDASVFRRQRRGGDDAQAAAA